MRASEPFRLFWSQICVENTRSWQLRSCTCLSNGVMRCLQSWLSKADLVSRGWSGSFGGFSSRILEVIPGQA